MDELRVALFGPQATQWTHESLSKIRSTLLYNETFSFLKRTLLGLPSLWSLLEGDFSSKYGFSGLHERQLLQEFVNSSGDLDGQNLTNN
jgi:hypothetical protein